MVLKQPHDDIRECLLPTRSVTLIVHAYVITQILTSLARRDAAQHALGYLMRVLNSSSLAAFAL